MSIYFIQLLHHIILRLLAAHGIFSKIDHLLGHKAILSKYEKIEIIPCILSDHNALKLEHNNKNKDKKLANS
jgi:hypothetical protein